jgi:hypothetical protein
MSLVSIGATFLPVIVQNLYNLKFTNSMQQVFYEDIDSLIITLALTLILSIDIYFKNKKVELAFKA